MIATELRGFGPFGGFGVLTHEIALGLRDRGLEVSVVVPRQDGQRPVELVDGLIVYSYPSPLYSGLHLVRIYKTVYRLVDADIYHSEEPSLGTALAQLGAPDRKHIVTFQDPRTIQDWRKQWMPSLPNKLWQLKFMLRYQWEVGRAVRRADARYCQAKYIIEKAAHIFRLSQKPGFLPNPVRFTEIRRPKQKTPTVCFVGRWDPIKRPELFLELAGRFPEVRFIMVGACLSNSTRDMQLRERAVQLRNVEAPGWMSHDEIGEVLDQSWVLINTSSKECLPVTYLEAAAHKCAILSHGNADEFASDFGYWAKQGDLDDYVRGLGYLLDQHRWRPLGEKAYSYVLEVHEYNNVIKRHLEVYQELLEK
ncbi:MAG: glycosyltransferase family 4 protein [Veillonellaceae bacterium]|nr:glycosyltransferase family 4 protein [Veillonellaceae bacterium]